MGNDGSHQANKIVPLDARSQVAHIAQESGRVIFTNHAKDRMVERRVTRQQVLRCLLHGYIVEHPAPDIHGNTKMTLEVMSAGDAMNVVAVLKRDVNNDLVVIVTVFIDQ